MSEEVSIPAKILLRFDALEAIQMNEEQLIEDGNRSVAIVPAWKYLL